MSSTNLNLTGSKPPGSPPQSSQENLMPLSPRAAQRIEEMKKISPRKVAILDPEKRAEAKRERVEEKRQRIEAEKQRQIAETLYNSEMGKLEVEVIKIETTEIVSSPRRDFNQKLELFERGLSTEKDPQEARTKIETAETIPQTEFQRRLQIFGQPSAPQIVPTTTTTTTSSASRRPLPPLPSGGLPSQESAGTIVTSPRREARVVLPPVTPREPEKKT